MVNDPSVIEVIIINDGSTDRSINILDKFISNQAFEYIVLSKANGGVSTARNYGIQRAQGRWITFLDSDDYIAPNYFIPFLKTISAVQENVSIIASGHCVVNIDGSLEKNQLPINGDIDTLLLRISMYSFTKLFRRDYIIKYNLSYYPDLRIGEDALFFFDYLTTAGCNIVAINSTDYYYVRRSGSLSNSPVNIDYRRKLNDYHRFRFAITECVSKCQLSDKVWRHWRAMLGHDLYEMIGDLRSAGQGFKSISKTLNRDFTHSERNDLKYLPCSLPRRILNALLLFYCK